MTDTKELIVLYEVHEYKRNVLLCQYSSEYPKDLKSKVNQSNMNLKSLTFLRIRIKNKNKE